jgi:hypothetical protein
MFSYLVLLAAEGLSPRAQQDPIWQNEVGMILDRMSARACYQVSAIAEEFRLDSAEAIAAHKAEAARLQTEIAVIRERSEQLQIQINKAEAEREALRVRLSDLAERIEAFYATYASRQQQVSPWFQLFSTPPSTSHGSAPSPGGG